LFSISLKDFLENHKNPAIDFVAIHVWPDNWGMKTTEFLKKFIREHIEVTIYS
jgi:hypothetical protein